MNAIETHALTRRFGAHTAVDGLDLTVRQGELFALLGVNGAGKTTTLRMLSGLLQPTGGEADILGFRLTQQPQEIKRRINLSPAGDGRCAEPDGAGESRAYRRDLRRIAPGMPRSARRRRSRSSIWAR